MLPKVATHILHTTSRAAAQAVQAPLRNVLHTGTSNGSNIGNRNGPGSSNWGGHGPGTGSAKQNTGSRYYSSFNTAGRAVSQANAVSANDGTFGQSDENDDHHLSRRVVVIQTQSGSSTKRPRIRSSSVSLTKAESLGVLKTLQLQGRTRFLHTSTEAASQPQLQSITPLTPSRPRRNSTSSSDGLDRPASPVRNFSDSGVESGFATLPESPVRPRRNSISSTGDLNLSTIELTDPALEQIDQVLRSRRNSASSADESQQSEQLSVDTKSTTPPLSKQQSPTSSRVSRPSTPASSSSASSRFPYLVEAQESGNPHHVAEAVARFRSEAKDATVEDFNLALEALLATREGESIMPMLETYNDMIKYSIHPNAKTYHLVLSSLNQRDNEVEQTLRSLRDTTRRAQVFGEWEGVSLQRLQHRMDILRLEQQENFASIVSLYSVSKPTVGVLSVDTYGAVLRSCTHNSNIDVAIDVFRHAEQTFENLRPQYYQFMVQIYGQVKNIAAAEHVFRQYIAAGRQGKVHLDESAHDYQKRHILVWNAMINAYLQCGLPDKAVEVLDQMMHSPAGVNFTYADTPLPAAATYTTILKGFCTTGDVHTALTWYERLRDQGVSLDNVFTPFDQPIKPNWQASIALIEALAANGLVAELNRIFPTLELNTNMHLVPYYVYSANMRALAQATDPQQMKEILDFVSYQVFPKIRTPFNRELALPITFQYLERGFLDESYKFFAPFFNQSIANIDATSRTSGKEMTYLRNIFYRFSGTYLRTAIAQDRLTADGAASVVNMACVVGLGFIFPAMHKPLLHAYAIAKANNQLPVESISMASWQELLRMAVRTEGVSLTSPAASLPESDNIPNYAFGGVFSLVEDLARYQVDVTSFPESLMEQTIQHLVSFYGPHSVIGAFEQFGPAFKQVLDNSATIVSLRYPEPADESTGATFGSPRSQRMLANHRNLVIDPAKTKIVDDLLLKQSNVRSQVMAAYRALKEGVEQRRVPALRTIGRLIQGLGRQGDVQKVHELYEIAQEAYKGLELAHMSLRDGWICIEDSMIIALAHAGDIDNAHVHRLRLIDQGAAPSADAYGALILYVKDTTDDAANGMMLFREALQANVEMNIYLYNNIISKLAKARKADHALELFQKMKAQGINPTSITYGALIGACARVGDISSSEALFAEMVEQKNFKPRVPPYNTMMQLYTMTKPNRERALWFHQQMTAAGVQPTAHTYKLLLDAYGSIEPVDIASMEAVFQELQNDTNVKIQGTHYASLINAYGCVQRDLDKAIATFEAVPRSSGALDAVVFESIINVFVSHRRTDLIPEYISKMTASGVHMTAYIANFLIKGYAISGELDKSREIFESLLDPPTGVAAPHNHAPHDPAVGKAVGWMEPVYREPSTWEAMVRAELGAGYRDRALDLLQRLKSRQYPEAVYNRISGVMVDHSSLV